MSSDRFSMETVQPQGFDRLFAEHHDLVYGIGLRILGTHEDAEDVTQEVFTKVWRGLETFNHASSPKTWIYRIAVNTAIDHGRKPWKKIDVQSTALEADSADHVDPPQLVNQETAEARLLAREKVVTLSQAIARLRPHLKDVFVLKEVEELSYDEISSILGLSMGTISSRLNRARKALQESLSALTSGRGLAGMPA